MLFRAVALVLFLSFLTVTGFVSAQRSPSKAAEKKPSVEEAPSGNAEALLEKEQSLRKEEERLNQIRQDLDKKIAQYSELLVKMEATLKAMETAKDERFTHLIKAYEAMESEEAAVRLSGLDESTAVRIISGMKSKKAGAAMAAMAPEKAASLTEGILKVTKKFPTK